MTSIDEIIGKYPKPNKHNGFNGFGSTYGEPDYIPYQWLNCERPNRNGGFCGFGDSKDEAIIRRCARNQFKTNQERNELRATNPLYRHFGTSDENEYEYQAPKPISDHVPSFNEYCDIISITKEN